MKHDVIHTAYCFAIRLSRLGGGKGRYQRLREISDELTEQADAGDVAAIRELLQEAGPLIREVAPEHWPKWTHKRGLGRRRAVVCDRPAIRPLAIARVLEDADSVLESVSKAAYRWAKFSWRRTEVAV